MEDAIYYSSILSTTPPSSSSNPPHPSPADTNEVKQRIMVHPHYPRLVAAYAACKLLGAPPEVAARLSAISSDIQNRPGGCNFPTADPELDQFMEEYCDILVKYREEISRPLEEAVDFLRKAESQLSCIVGGRSNSSFSSSADDEKCGAACSDSQEGLLLDSSSVGETFMEEKIWAEDRELKNQLLRKYSGYLGSLREELSKKRKKGKLPREARQKLLGWWEFHNKWPYPSEPEKKALAESTGLDQQQINNWFINQRKRHWKPSEEMRFMVFDGYQHQQQQNSSSFFMEGPFMGDGSMYRIGP